jgi:hypothetical protein
MTEQTKTRYLRTILAAGAMAVAGGVASAAPLSYGGDANLIIPGWNDGDILIGGVPYDPSEDAIIQSYATTGDISNFNP